MDVEPIPTTTASAVASARMPASLRSPTSRSFGHLRSGVNPADLLARRRAASPTAAVTRCQPDGRQVERTQQDRHQQGGHPVRSPTSGPAAPAPRSGGRPPPPAPRSAPAAARSATSRLVESITSSSSMVHEPGGVLQVVGELAPRPDTLQECLPVLSKVLIANRGEIAVRVIRTCRELGIDDRGRLLRPGPRRPSRAAGGRGVRPRRPDGGRELPGHGQDPRHRRPDPAPTPLHPGYGFFAENADFARAVTEAGVTWIGPPPEAIEVMGDKISSRLAAQRADVAGVPGTTEVLTVGRRGRRLR